MSQWCRNFLRLLQILVLSFVLMLNSVAAANSTDVAWVRQVLADLYVRYPTTRITADEKNMAMAAEVAFGPEAGVRMSSFIKSNSELFNTIREQVDATTPVVKNGKRAVVSGGSIVGMVQAIMLARIGYEVELFDQRNFYTRNIHWAIRQSLYDQLTSIDSVLGRSFNQVAKDLDSSIHIAADGTKSTFSTQGRITPNPSRIPKSGSEMLAQPSVMTVEAKMLENVLLHYIQRRALNIKVKNQKLTVKQQANSNSVTFNELDYIPDEIVLAEGSGSENMKALKINNALTAAPRLQIAGEIYIQSTPTGGTMVKRYRSENGDALVTYTMETKGSARSWVVGDIHPSSIEPGHEFDKASEEEYKAERERLIEKEFRRLAAQVIDAPEADLQKADVAGPFEGAKKPAPFWLDQRISKTAIYGSNVRLAGDTVGNATPTVGGGMQMGATAHTERAKELYLQLDIIQDELAQNKISTSEAQTNKNAAREVYSKSVIADTLTWHRAGVPDMYLHIADLPKKIKRLPHESKFALSHNVNVDRLEQDLQKITTEEILRRTDSKVNPYYRIPLNEVQTPEGIARWKKKLSQWAYHDFIRRTFDESISLYKNGNIPQPLNYMIETLPNRPNLSTFAWTFAPAPTRPSLPIMDATWNNRLPTKQCSGLFN